MLVLAFSTGCGGGSSSTSTPTENTTSTEKTGYLIDSAVEGVDYTCGTLVGVTDSNGKFLYDVSKCPNGIEFKLKDLSLRTINPSAINSDTYLTLQELAGKTRNDVTDETVQKMAVLLQSLDEDNDPTNGIKIDSTLKSNIALSGNLSEKTDNEISTEITARGKTEKDVHTALTHLLEFTKSRDSSVTADITPQDFTIANQTGTALNSQIISDTITLSGLTIPTLITILNGEYSLDNGTTWKSTKSLVSNGQTVKVRHTTANSLSGTTTTTLKIGGVTKTFGSTTLATLPVFQSGETWKGKVYNTVTFPFTGKVWLDRNLGASQVCTAYNDTACYGDYYQGGRESDGHQVSNSATNGTRASAITSVGDKFWIELHYWENDWTTVDGNGALRSANWSKTDGTSVCPVGFRVPTETELANETSGATTFSNFLKFPSAGFRNNNGSMVRQDLDANIWVNSLGRWSNVRHLDIDSSNSVFKDLLRAYGLSVRCIRD